MSDEGKPTIESVEPQVLPEPVELEPAKAPSAGARLPHVPWVPVGIVAALIGILGFGAFLFHRATSRTNDVALVSEPKGVTVVAAKAASFRATRHYVGVTEPWLRAKIGPQLTSAYVDTMLFRPGAFVKRNEVLATLDCRNQSARSQAVALAARALASKQTALAHEAARMSGLVDGGFVSQNEVEKKVADSESQQAELLAARARLMGTALEVDDCVLRAPFDGEVSERTVDPGAFVKPGTSLLSLVDRSTVRVTADVPEIDFAIVAPGTPVRVHVLATGVDLKGTVARRDPSADPGTRTVHCEVDIADPTRLIPVGTTAELSIEVGEASATAEVPLVAASIRGSKATMFTVENGIAHSIIVPVRGEAAGFLYLDPPLRPGAMVVTEGRALLIDGDRVASKIDGQIQAKIEGKIEGKP